MDEARRMSRKIRTALLLALALPALAGCAAFGELFESGLWTGIVVALLVFMLVGFVASRMRR